MNFRGSKNSLFGAVIGLTLAQSGSAHEVRNGGDSLAIRIYRMGDELLERWSTMTPQCRNQIGFDFGKISAQWDRALVETTPKELYLEGQFVEAINTPATAHILFHRPSFVLSDEKAVLTFHEQMGLAELKDPKYKRSREAVALLMNPLCQIGSTQGQGTPAQAARAAAENSATQSRAEAAKLVPPVNMMPDGVAVDGDSLVYLLSGTEKLIYRYNLQTKSYGPVISLRYAAKSISLSKADQRLYVLSEGGRVTFFSLGGDLVEREFIVSPEPIQTMMAVDGYVLLLPYSGSWVRNYLFSSSGRLIANVDWKEPGSGFQWVPELKSVYYISQFSPRDLVRMPIENGQIGKSQDSPYHGDYPLESPIVASKEFVAVGTGYVFSAVGLKLVGRIPEAFWGGVWQGDQLVTAHQLDGKTTKLKWWSSRGFEVKSEQFAGIYVSIHTTEKGYVLVTLTDDGLRHWQF